MIEDGLPDADNQDVDNQDVATNPRSATRSGLDYFREVFSGRLEQRLTETLVTLTLLIQHGEIMSQQLDTINQEITELKDAIGRVAATQATLLDTIKAHPAAEDLSGPIAGLASAITSLNAIASAPTSTPQAVGAPVPAAPPAVEPAPAAPPAEPPAPTSAAEPAPSSPEPAQSAQPGGSDPTTKSNSKPASAPTGS